MTAFDSTCVSSFPQLLKYMLDKGVPCSKELIADGRIHRYSASEGRDKSEWYAIFDFEDGHYFATFGSWKDSLDFKHEFRSWKEDFDPFYFDHVLKCQAETKQRLEAEQKGAIVKAQEAFTSCSIAESHPYLDRKKVGAHGLKIRGEELLVPVFSSSNELLTFQRIFPDGSKYFFPGAPSSLGRLVLGDLDKAKRVLVAEGYATGASIHECTGECVVIAFSASNCPKVGLELSLKHKDKKVVLAGDLGADKCIAEWKDRVNGEVLLPNMKGKEGKDWNDVHVQLGKEEVKKQITGLQVFEVKGVEDFMQAEYEPVRALVQEMFREGSVNLIFGSPGSGKSLFCTDLALCIATGMPFFRLAAMKKRVLYIDGELPDNVLHTRYVHAFRRFTDNGANDLKIDPFHLGFITVDLMLKKYERRINIFTELDREILTRTVENYDVIIVDSISFMTSLAGLKVKDYRDEELIWQEVSNWCYQLQKMDKTIIFVSHTLKNSEVMKGSSVINQFMETTVKLLPDEKAERKEDFAKPIKIVYEKNRNFVNFERLPTTVYLIRDAENMGEGVRKTFGWYIGS